MLFSTNVFAADYYLSNSGDDSNSGLSPDTPWKTIDKLNQAVLNAGDRIFFKSGEVFYGNLILKYGGSASSAILISSYGEGSLPIISGAKSLDSWTLNNGMYETTLSQTPSSLFIDNQQMIIARYPNEGSYLTLDQGNKSYIKDSSITSLSTELFNQSEICIHTAQWCWEKTKIASVSSDQINFQTPVALSALAQYGYFIYNNLNLLDVEKEWYYDSTNQKIYLKYTGDINALKTEVAIYTNGIEIQPNVSYVTIQNLAFEKQTNSGVNILAESNTSILIDNCSFFGQYNHGVNVKGISVEIKNSSFNKINGIAIYVNGKASDTEIHHNNFTNIGEFRNYGIGTEINLSAIQCGYTSNAYIHHNNIDGAGYCGISIDGNNHIVERNIIKNVMLINNDGGAIKSHSEVSKNNLIQNNFISTSDGNTEGTFKANFITPAIYFDFNVNNCIVKNNTIYNRTQKGIFLNSGTNNNTITGNVIYGFNYGIDLNGNPLMPTPMTGMTVTDNQFFAKSTDSYFVRLLDNTGGYNQGTINNNIYYQPYSSTRFGFIPPSNELSFSSWQQTTGFDTDSKTAFMTWSANEMPEVLYLNPTDETVVIELDNYKYYDLSQNEICGSFELLPYTSKIVIKSSNECTTLSSGLALTQDTSVKTILFPNPVKDNFTIKTPFLNDSKIFIYNSFGQLVQEESIANGLGSYSANHLPAGMYYLTIQNETIKFLKE